MIKWISIFLFVGCAPTLPAIGVPNMRTVQTESASMTVYWDASQESDFDRYFVYVWEIEKYSESPDSIGQKYQYYKPIFNQNVVRKDAGIATQWTWNSLPAGRLKLGVSAMDMTGNESYVTTVMRELKPQVKNPSVPKFSISGDRGFENDTLLVMDTLFVNIKQYGIYADSSIMDTSLIDGYQIQVFNDTTFQMKFALPEQDAIVNLSRPGKYGIRALVLVDGVYSLPSRDKWFKLLKRPGQKEINFKEYKLRIIFQ